MYVVTSQLNRIKNFCKEVELFKKCEKLLLTSSARVSSELIEHNATIRVGLKRVAQKKKI